MVERSFTDRIEAKDVEYSGDYEPVKFSREKDFWFAVFGAGVMGLTVGLLFGILVMVIAGVY